MVLSVSNATMSSLVTMYSTVWCGHCRRLKAALDRVGVEFREVDIEQDPAAASFVAGVNGGNHTVPTMLLADGSVLTNPSIDELLVATGSLQGLSRGGLEAL